MQTTVVGTEQPQLRAYQQEGVDFLLQHHRCGLVDEPGLGKTAQILTAIHRGDRRPVLICAPKSALGVWRDEIMKWLGAEEAAAALLYYGTAAQRHKLAKQGAIDSARYVITAYRTGLELLNMRKWRAIVCDEFHRVGLLNIRTATYKAFRETCCKRLPTASFYAVSGTPYTKGPQDFFGLLHLFDPRNNDFHSYWRFVDTHCIVTQSPLGYTEIHPRPKAPEEFREMLSHYFLRRSKRDILPQLPAKIRQVIPIDMSPKQTRLYRTLEQELMVQLQQNTVFALSPLALLTKLRQMLVSPCCLDEAVDDVGGGIEALLEMVELDFDANNSVLVFTPFIKGVETIERVLRARLKCKTFVIHGQLKNGMLPSDVAKAFQAEPSVRKVLVCTIKTGQAWDATAANVVYFLGYEWAAVENEQAEDRVHRIGQQKSVVCKYLKYTDTVDQDILQIVLSKELGFSASLDVGRFNAIIQARLAKRKV